MGDKYLKENPVLRAAAQASGRLKRPQQPPDTTPQEPQLHSSAAGEAFGEVGFKPDRKRVAPFIIEL